MTAARATRLVNGRQEPEIEMAAGQIERWRIVNAASARYRAAVDRRHGRSRSSAPTAA